jgi:CHASE3 domain sensor protein
MDAEDRTLRLLEEIRDTGREHLSEYRRVTQQLLELQQRVAARQERIGRTYRFVVLLGGVLVVLLLGLLGYLLVRFSHLLLR